MSSVPQFLIVAPTFLCDTVRAYGFIRFDQLAWHVQSLPYGRLCNPKDLTSVLVEGRGTCSTKHRLLAAVAKDCGECGVHLTVGIYAMSEQNTPGVGEVLGEVGLSSIPEAHCYLTIDNERMDFTGLSAGTTSAFSALLEEHTVPPEHLSQIKLTLHMEAIKKWAPSAGLSAAQAWEIRERCIEVLARD